MRLELGITTDCECDPINVDVIKNDDLEPAYNATETYTKPLFSVSIFESINNIEIIYETQLN